LLARLTFKEVKAHAIFFLLELEKLGKITRIDGFQGILNAIASDVRSKHRKRLQRQQEMSSMNDALKHLQDRKKYFEEQIDSYHNYVEAAMATMQRGKGYDILSYKRSTSIDVATAKTVSLFPSPNNTFTSGICRNLAQLRNSAPSSIAQRHYMRKEFYCRLTHSRLDSLTRLTSLFHRTRREPLQWRYITIPSALQTV
jgi:hypothetical protein